MLRIISIAAAVSVVGGLFVAGCGQKATPEATKPTVADSTTSLPIYKNDKGQIVCPVTGEVIASVKDAAGSQDFQGKRYYFCCSMCPPKFKANPEKYAIRHETEKM